MGYFFVFVIPISVSIYKLMFVAANTFPEYPEI
jgi:hypothetical protein